MTALSGPPVTHVGKHALSLVFLVWQWWDKV